MWSPYAKHEPVSYTYTQPAATATAAKTATATTTATTIIATATTKPSTKMKNTYKRYNQLISLDRTITAWCAAKLQWSFHCNHPSFRSQQSAESIDIGPIWSDRWQSNVQDRYMYYVYIVDRIKPIAQKAIFHSMLNFLCLGVALFVSSIQLLPSIIRHSVRRSIGFSCLLCLWRNHFAIQSPFKRFYTPTKDTITLKSIVVK